MHEMRFTGKKIAIISAVVGGIALLLILNLSSAPPQPNTATSSDRVSSAGPSVDSSNGSPGSGQKSDRNAPQVQTIKPARRNFTHTLTLPANIAPWLQATLYAKVPGYLKWMGADKGDKVKKGQLLAVIDAPEVEQQFRQAEADHKIKALTYHRLLTVWKENPDVIAKQDLDVAGAAAEGAKHLMENRRTVYEYTNVDAPFSGTITARFVDPGTMIQSGAGSVTQAAPLYTLMDLEQVRVYVSVPQEAAHLAKPGIPVKLTVKELAEQEFDGTITRTTEALDPATRTLLVEIDMPNKERFLQPGMFVTVTLQLQQHQNVLSVPPNAILTPPGGSQTIVFVVKDGVVRRRPVKTGFDDGVALEVTEGLTEDDEVVVVGKTGLKDGLIVKSSPYSLPSGKPASQKY
jgi:RND family efflux transporter MFP subunit